MIARVSVAAVAMAATALLFTSCSIREPLPPWHVDSYETPTPKPSPTPREWVWVGMACWDGWPSPSIGKRGACSHHGGVTDLWRNREGVEVVCGISPDGRETYPAWGDRRTCRSPEW